MNPVVKSTADEIIGNVDRIYIIESLNVVDLHTFQNKIHIILTDG